MSSKSSATATAASGRQALREANEIKSAADWAKKAPEIGVPADAYGKLIDYRVGDRKLKLQMLCPTQKLPVCVHFVGEYRSMLVSVAYVNQQLRISTPSAAASSRKAPKKKLKRSISDFVRPEPKKVKLEDGTTDGTTKGTTKDA
jgi:hypothetical protein